MVSCFQRCSLSWSCVIFYADSTSKIKRDFFLDWTSKVIGFDRNIVKRGEAQEEEKMPWNKSGIFPAEYYKNKSRISLVIAVA